MVLMMVMVMAAALLGVPENQRLDDHRNHTRWVEELADVDVVEFLELHPVDRADLAVEPQIMLE